MKETERSTYARLYSEYLVDCFMYQELAVVRTNPLVFIKMAKDLAENWDSFQHPHKGLTTKLQVENTHKGENIKFFPSIIRSIGCYQASKYAGNPMTNRSHAYIQSYVKEMSLLYEEKQDAEEKKAKLRDILLLKN